VGEGGRGRARLGDQGVSEGEGFTWVGDGSLGLREAEGEGGEGFYIARAAGALICLYSDEAENLEEVELPLPCPVRVGERCRPELAEAPR
jgi:hypothetical protein